MTQKFLTTRAQLRYNKCSMMAKKRELAFAFYLDRKSLRTIAVELCVSRSTVERWSKSDDFVNKRKKHLEQLQLNIQRKMVEEASSEFLSASFQARQLLFDGLTQLRLSSEGRKPQNSILVTKRGLLNLYRMYEMATNADLKLSSILEKHMKKN